MTAALSIGSGFKPALRPIDTPPPTYWEYRIPEVGTIYWATRPGTARLPLDWQATLEAMQKSTIPAFKKLFTQAELFFTAMDEDFFAGEMPPIVTVKVVHPGILPGSDLGDFYLISYRERCCVIPGRIKVEGPKRKSRKKQ